MPITQTITINGWEIFAHPMFLEQFEDLVSEVEHLRQKDPQNYLRKNTAKRLAAIIHLAFEVIPQDPTRSEYRQGTSLGDDYKHWFKAKFFQQYRLFFRFHQSSKIIVMAWINDEDTKRAYGSKTDAYRVFRKMLDSGHPPNDWHLLLQEAKAESMRFTTHIPQVKLLSRYFQRSVNSYSDSFNLHSQLLSFTENKCGSLSNSLTF